MDGPGWFSTWDLQYAYSQFPINDATSKLCNLKVVSGDVTGTNKFLAGFSGLTDMSTVFQKAIDWILNGIKNTICSPDDILIASKCEKDKLE